MKTKNLFYREFLKIAIPVAMQSLLQSSFSMVDQIMTGQLGEISIAGIGLAGKFAGLFSVVLAAIAAVAGIMIAQYLGKRDYKGVGCSFYLNLVLALIVSVFFTVICVTIPKGIMGLYTVELATRDCAAVYLQIVAWGFLPTTGSLLLSTLLRCEEKASIPLYATLFNAILNTILNYCLIFGKFGFPELGVAGAAWATVIAQWTGFLIILVSFLWLCVHEKCQLPFSLFLNRNILQQFVSILTPILVCEFFWGLGENVYAAIYGHIGTDGCAAMTLINPMVGLFIGALSGISQAAAILIGKQLGAGEFETAYSDSKKLMWYGFVGSVSLSLLLIGLGQFYVQIFQVENTVRTTAYQLLVVFSIFAPVKVLNMILGGGIIRSGGQTKLVMVIDLIGTWGFGVPIGLLTAFAFGLPITWVYAFLSTEECIRLVMAFCVFRRKKWMVQLERS